MKREIRRRRKLDSERGRSINEWKQDTARHAAKGFFRNTGTYVRLWQGMDFQESNLLNILDNYESQSEIIRLFIFDGFVPWHKKKKLNSIKLPMGELRKYTEKELENLLILPQSSWHGTVNPEVIKKAAIWHILTLREGAEYRGMTGIWSGGLLISSIDFTELGKPIRKESDVDIIGPVFLCIGEDANLSVEIRVRLNIFEYFPVHHKVRNDYLPWDSYDEDGEPIPRQFVHSLGEDGNKLRKVYELWQNVNDLDPNGLLRYPTEAYVRSVMNLHASWESLMETFVGFMTVIESLLTPGDHQELTYKLAVRGAALLAFHPEHRGRIFQVLNEFYKTRSTIVHEGRTDKDEPFEFKNMISHNLTQISRQIFLRYICLLNMGLKGELPEGVLHEPKKLSTKNNRSKTIAKILDSLVFDPGLTKQLEKRMEAWGVNGDWIRMMSLRLFGTTQFKEIVEHNTNS